MARFHLAFPVHDLDATRVFYADVLDCRIGREAEGWIDFDFHGHQISAHLIDAAESVPEHPVDGKQVPVRHFGLIVAWDEWEALAQRLHAHGVHFIIEPYVRFKGNTGEQGTFFVQDPSGNALEFKAFRSDADIFRRD